MRFLREQDGRHVFSFRCPGCHAAGELGIPKTRAGLIRHDCGTLFKHDPGYSGARRPTIQVFIPTPLACYGTIEAERAAN